MVSTLRPLKTQQLLPIFKVLDREKKGRLGLQDLDYVFAEMLGTNLSAEELNFTMKHLISLGTVAGGAAAHGHESRADTQELDFSTFIDLVNSTLKLRPLEDILSGTFAKLAEGKDRITVEDLLKLAKKAGIEAGSDARVRLVTRIPTESADLKQFCKCVAGT
ncbi:2x Ef calmodulin-like [Babesia ovis]|uniref:2x Ef calmodulin-like n=1 Tax=Babesia ovis TaxID=5869 RepID=A0A9W5TDG4_BABOV|nr:2x Ef calmodulin-like [Babesia ovis]